MKTQGGMWLIIVGMLPTAAVALDLGTLPPGFQPVQAERACQDFYASTCLNANGSNNYSVSSEVISDLQNTAFSKMFQAVVAASGKSSFAQIVSSALSAKGITLLPPAFSPYASVLEIPTHPTMIDMVSEDKYISSFAACRNTGAQMAQAAAANNTVAFEESLQKLNTLKAFNEQLEIKLLYEEPATIITELSNACQFSQALTESVRSACAQISQTQKAFLNAYRARSTQKGQEQLKQIVNQLYGIVKKPIPSDLTLDNFKSRSNELQARVADACKPETEIVKKIVSTTAIQAQLNVVSSKPAIKAFFDAIYTAQRKQKVESLVTRFKNEIPLILKSKGATQEQVDLIAADFENVQLTWPDIDKIDKFIIDPQTGLEVLNPSAFENSAQSGENSLLTSFLDPTLNSLISINAFYMPHMTVGRINYFDEGITLLPAITHMVDKYPQFVAFVLGHELAHKVDPNNQFYSGYGIDGIQEPVNSCYESAQSIGATKIQRGEIFADFLGTELLALLINESSATDKSQVLAAAMIPFCSSGSANAPMDRSLANSHPHMIYRIGATFGANEASRKILGCESLSNREEPLYATCGWKGIQ